MESYRIAVKRSAAKEIADLPRADCKRVVEKVGALARDPRPAGCEKLTGDDKYRMRQGAYRILYEIDDDARTVTIVKVAHRKDVYR